MEESRHVEVETLSDTTRYAYCKNGDVVQQLGELGPIPREVPEGGPDVYTASFLRTFAAKPILLMSYADRDAKLCADRVAARVFTIRSSSFGLLGRALVWSRIFVRTVIHVYAFAPTLIFCAASSTPLLACYLVARVRSVPFVTTRHAALLSGRLPLSTRITEAINRWVIKRADGVMCHGPFLASQLIDLGVNPERLFQFGISYRYLIDNPNSPPEEPLGIALGGENEYMLFIGRMREEKGIFDLLAATTERLRRDQHLRLLYVGGGLDTPRLEKEIKRLNLEEKVILMGYLEHDKVPQLIKQCKLVVTPTRSSFSESRCKSAIEALVLGKPVVAPNFGPFPYVFQHRKNGLLYTPDSVADLKKNIEMALSDSDLYGNLVEGAQESAKEYLDYPSTFSVVLKQAFEKVSKSWTKRSKKL